ncbi:hypothetical protein [Pseudochelatococcus sp. G4_1912]|uniref:hypothetical protein n=1 Tax=Pseudochelatococcus sp. G4_1912 TaxID=3114288 RepID=UPI0039C6FBB0
MISSIIEMAASIASGDIIEDCVHDPRSHSRSSVYTFSFNEESLSFSQEAHKFCGRVISCLASAALPVVYVLNTAYSVVIAAVSPPLHLLFYTVRHYREGNGVLSSIRTGIESAEDKFKESVGDVSHNMMKTINSVTECAFHLVYTPAFEIMNIAGLAVCGVSYLSKSAIGALEERFGDVGNVFCHAVDPES